MLPIILYKNSIEIDYSTGSIIEISDRDTIFLKIISHNNIDLEVYLEDYIIPTFFSEKDYCFYTHEDRIFRESFGYASIRVFVNNDLYQDILFKINTNEEKFTHIKNMVNFLLKNNERVLDICLSRTKHKFGNQNSGLTTFETVISTAEDIISFLQEKRSYFKYLLKKKLVSHKEEKNQYNKFNIEPFEIVNNIDKLIYSDEYNSLKIGGKGYSLDHIERSNYTESYDSEENNILLGGMISVKNVLLDLHTTIKKHKNLENISYEKEYANFKSFDKNYSIEDLYISVTTDGMLKRIETLFESIENIIIELKEKLSISFKGYIYPYNNAYIKNSSFYKNIFKKLLNWYDLGTPSLGANENLIKIRSISKIYEIFCLYTIIDIIYRNGWSVISTKEHPTFKNFIPNEIEFYKKNYTLEFFYEKTINIFSEAKNKHFDLVYLDHQKTSNYKYYTPDFIIKVTKSNQDIRYFIFDAKYSDINTLVKFKVIDELYRKYYTNIAIFDINRSVFSSEKIHSVIALNPFGKKKVKKWHSISGYKIYPIVESCKINFDECDFYNYIQEFEF